MKKNKINFMSLLLVLGILPVLISIIVSTFVSVNKLSSSLEEDVYSRLTTATTSLKEYYEHEISELGYADVNNNEYIDSLKNEGIELTLFKEDTRIATSIFKDGSTTERNVGTKADSIIYADVKSGNKVQKNGVTIGGSKYYVVYQPIYDNNGNFWGMSFAGESQESVEKAVSSARNTLISMSFILIIICGILIIFISIKLKKSIIESSDSLNVLASGNLSQSVNAKSPILEISNMIDSTITLQSQLKNAIDSVKQSAYDIGDAVSEVDGKVEATANSVSQISQAINEVASTSQNVAESAQILATKADVLGQNIETLTENTSVLIEETKEIKKANDEANNYMTTVLNSSNQSVEAVNAIAKDISDTNDAVRDIQSCISMINEIASETKLLSLNASIEAARAGDAGRGFAVVAQNIKSLAESSSENVDKISDIINRVTKLSEQSVKGANKVKDIITEEQKYILDTQNKFELLSKSVESSIEEIHSISDKTKELDIIKQDLIGATTDLGAISEELGASAEEVSATCESVDEMCKDNKNKTEEMRNTNEALNASVSFFS